LNGETHLLSRYGNSITTFLSEERGNLGQRFVRENSRLNACTAVGRLSLGDRKFVPPCKIKFTVRSVRKMVSFVVQMDVAQTVRRVVMATIIVSLPGVSTMNQGREGTV
jgi:hypothetical protein